MTMPANNRPLRIAFAKMDQAEWTAGTHYLKNLFIALQSLSDPCRPEVTLLISPGLATQQGDGLEPYIHQILYSPQPGFFQRLYNFVHRKLDTRLGPTPFLGSYLRLHQINVVFATVAEFGPGFNMPLLSWIPDFQHIRLPNMFSPALRQSLDKNFSRVIKYADRVILSSHSALNDLEYFAPHSVHKARVLSFVAQVPADVHDLDPEYVCAQYHLPQRFIYLPNQFWKHKNHEVVIQALTIVKSQRSEITVVCTGNTNDHRHPLHFAKLLASISARNLRHNFVILGMIPHGHLFQLMRQSLAVLQPSLFEGWSTTIEEVKSVGKNVIASDIPVHREQAPPDVIYFDPHDPEALANCMIEAYNEKRPGPDYDLEAIAQQQLPKRTQEFGQAFVGIVNEVAQA